MVHLNQKSNVDHNTSPFAHQWDTLVRRNFSTYQYLIDAQTYQTQRIQRFIFSYKYPRGYNSDLITLNLMKAKQSVGEVLQQQVDLYKNINSSISCDFNRVFSSKLPIPYAGAAIGSSLLLYGTYFNSSIPTRFMFFAIPTFIDFLRSLPDAKVEHRVTQFLDWVIGYRKAKAFSQKYKGIFNNQQTRKILGDSHLPDLGRQLVNLASK